ncbi:hypothetical protein ALC62_14033 [Cyphomyrmex costatus]|uniref:Uncharacterized protein n=1 Tax=Cyphomyrmex costatus TaxID=456900 RepID=A0A151I9A1_9HYME|nr:hypothetical protein ALC62_14033 [Cyphomyrmex costatus]
MIRAHLRLLGRFLFSLKEIDNTVTDFTSVYDSKTYDNCIKAVHDVAPFDDITNTYKVPYNASTLGTLIKKVGFLLRSVCIKNNNIDKQTMVEEHRNHIKRNTTTRSVITEHRLQHGHDFRWNEVEVLDEESNYRKRIVSEMINIKKQKNSLNLQTDTENLHETYIPLINKI